MLRKIQVSSKIKSHHFVYILGILVVKVCLFVCYAFKRTKQGEDAEDEDDDNKYTVKLKENVQ